MIDPGEPHIYLVRSKPLDVVISSLEEALADDGLFRIMDEDPDGAGTRHFYAGLITEEWVAVWDQETTAAPD